MRLAPWPTGGLTRRTLVRRGAAAAAMLTGGTAPLWYAAPVRASTKTTVVWAPWHDSANFSPELVGLFQDAIRPFLAANPSINVAFSSVCCDAGTFLALALSGQGPDLSQQYQFGPLRNANILLDLAPYIKRDNVDLGVFSPGRLAYWTLGQSLYGLPSYTNVYGTIINLGVLDDLGIAYPAPDWTYHDAVSLWRATTKGGSKPQMGGNLITEYGGNLPAEFYLHGFGGSMHDPNDRTKCGLGTPEAIACGEFWYGAQLDGIATTYGGGDCFPAGLQNTPPTIVDTFGTCDMVDIASKLNGIKWDLWLMPSMPKGRFTTAGPDSYLINAATKHPDETWELLKWVATQPFWQRWQMRTLLGGPVLDSLWPEYTDVLKQVAPPLRNKNLAVIGEASPEIALRSTFTYADTAANNIANKWGGLILSRKVSVAEGFTQAARQIDALQAGSASGAAALAKEVASTEAALAHAATVQSAITLQAPGVTGAGNPAKPASAALRRSGTTFTLTGTGGGVYGTGDSCTFAGSQWLMSRGGLTCRLVSIVSIGGKPVTAARVGLMARGDLSDQAAEVAYAVSLDRGLHVNLASLPDGTNGDEQTGGVGLLNDGSLLVPSSQTAANYLKKPLWMRLTRDAASWTAWYSLDGSSWVQVGAPVGIEMAGVWVGIFSTPHDSNKLQATFDHLSFPVTGTYQIGG